MGQRYLNQAEKSSSYQFRLMEVAVIRRGDSGEAVLFQPLAVDNHEETLRFVRENLKSFIDNVKKINRTRALPRQTKALPAETVVDAAGPLFAAINNKVPPGFFEKLSGPVRKSLLEIAMRRYRNDKASVCKVLSIDSDYLEKEMLACGLSHDNKAA